MVSLLTVRAISVRCAFRRTGGEPGPFNATVPTILIVANLCPARLCLTDPPEFCLSADKRLWGSLPTWPKNTFDLIPGHGSILSSCAALIVHEISVCGSLSLFHFWRQAKLFGSMTSLRLADSAWPSQNIKLVRRLC